MDILDFFEIIKNRRSIRNFSSRQIDKNIIEMLLEAARWAPSAGNRQPLEIIIVDDEELKQKLVEAAGRQSFLAKAPIVMLICADQERTSSKYGVRGTTLYCIQDTAAAIQNILLLATAFNLATCWIGAFNEDSIKKNWNLPENMRPVAMIPVGYAFEGINTHSAPQRRDISDFTHYNQYKKSYST